MRDRLPFSHLLPLLDLALLVLLVFVPITMTALRLYEVSKGGDPVRLRTGAMEVSFPRSQIVPLAIRSATLPGARTMMAINLPGALFQWLISLPTSESSHAGWHPQVLLLETWQALVLPFFALPFWWLVGCGLDGIVYKERLHVALRVIGTVCFALCLALLVTSRFPMSSSDRAYLTSFHHALLGWTIGFATLPAAWIAQSIRRKP